MTRLIFQLSDRLCIVQGYGIEEERDNVYVGDITHNHTKLSIGIERNQVHSVNNTLYLFNPHPLRLLCLKHPSSFYLFLFVGLLLLLLCFHLKLPFAFLNVDNQSN